MRFVNKKMVVVINKLVIELSGGLQMSGNNIRTGQNLGFIEFIHSNSIFGEQIYPSVFHQAAAYMFSIIKNHVFNDGNKRTGLLSAITFLEWNGILFSPLDEDAVFEFVISIAEGTDEQNAAIIKIVNWLKEMSLQ